MRHFNNFNDRDIEAWEVMKEFTVLFKGEQFRMQLICMFIRYPEYYFFIKEPEERSCLIGKLVTSDGRIFWNSRLSQEDAQELMMLIEQQTGLVLPEKHSNNPFKYQGDIHIRIYWIKKNGVTIKKAKAPFGNDMYYQIIFDGGRTFTFGKFFDDPTDGDGRWWPVEPMFDPDELKPFISLAETCDLYNKWKLES